MLSAHARLAVPLLAMTLIAQAADFPEPFNSEKDKAAQLTPAADATGMFKLPDGFKVTLCASEPDVMNPIALSWDSRGRLWIAENFTYAERPTRFELNLRDRILIFEDTDGDGKFDKRTVFTDNVQMLTSIEVGNGGVYLMCPPQVLFIPCKDDKPSGPAQVILDGFDPPPENYHNFANGLRFGPDGWLYGRCGASSPGKIGVPGTPAADRIPLTGGMWRYHPQRKIFEALCSGTTNPWGHDWNEYGDLFFINTVNGHLWHVIPGAHFVRPHTVDPNPYVYTMIDQHADHFHFDTGKSWTASRDGKANEYGGGHAHEGLMIYLGDNWPAQYRGKLFTWNFHGRRINQENLVREGSGYVGKHMPDLISTEDKWCRGIDLTYGPDGGVYLLDWSDTGECHESTGVHRTSGRIYKITYGQPKKPEIGDLAKLSASELVKLHTHPNEWFSRMARRQLAERAASGVSIDKAADELKQLFDTATDIPVKLRALWTLYCIGTKNERWVAELLDDKNEYVRAWALRMLFDRIPIDRGDSRRDRALPAADAELEKVSGELIKFASAETSPHVRLAWASTLQRLPISLRAEIAAPLLRHEEDSNDHNIPLMLWYALIPICEKSPSMLADLGAHCKIPITRKLIARRVGENIDSNPDAVNSLIAAAKDGDEAFATDILTGLSDGFVGKRKAPKPAAWDALAAKINAGNNAALKDRVRELSVFFGDGRALDELKSLALNSNADLNNRKAALATLIESKPDDLRQICEKLMGTRFLNATAAKGLALFDDPKAGAMIAKNYKNFHPSERPQAVEVLLARASFARALLDEIAAGQIPKGDITPFNARQIKNLGDDALAKKLAEVWGEIRESDAERKQMLAKLKTTLTPEVIAKADLSQGRAVFKATCSTCHKLYGEGGQIGPDLTGAGRDNMDYLLENIGDPSAVVSADFKMSIVALNDGRVFNGIITSKTDKMITLQTMNEKLTLETANIKRMKESSQSLMPEGLIEALKPEQVRDLFAYLMHRGQVPLPEEAGKK